jgi:hypothetical protein
MMGMYDKTPNFGDAFVPGDRFVLCGAVYVGTISTRYGDAEKSLFTIVSRLLPEEKIVYSALGTGFARQAQNAVPADFPHVAEYTVIPTGKDRNEVKLLAKVDVDPRAFIDGNDGPALPVNLDPATPGGMGPEEDLPF